MTRPSIHYKKSHCCNVKLVCSKCGKAEKSGTLFSLWLRERDELRSDIGYTTTDIDFVWRNYKKGWFILLEEKQKNGVSSYAQTKIYKMLDRLFKDNLEYKGYFKIVFGNRCPEDSEWIKINGVEYKGVKNGNIWEHETLMDLLKTGELNPPSDF